MPKKFSHWLVTLAGGAISGGATTALANLGPSVFNAGATAVGVTAQLATHKHPFDELVEQFISGALVGALMFLAKSPITDVLSTGDTQPFARTPNDPAAIPITPQRPTDQPPK